MTHQKRVCIVIRFLVLSTFAGIRVQAGDVQATLTEDSDHIVARSLVAEGRDTIPLPSASGADAIIGETPCEFA